MDYEFNQSSAPASAGCPQLPLRTPGDVLISFDAENGGAQIIVRAFEWNGSTFTETATGANAGGAVNIPNTIPGHKAGDFGEAAINLTDTIGEVGCGEFSGAYMKTRASTSLESALKDFTKRQTIATGERPQSSIAKAARNATDNPMGMFSTSVDAKPATRSSTG